MEGEEYYVVNLFYFTVIELTCFHMKVRSDI